MKLMTLQIQYFYIRCIQFWEYGLENFTETSKLYSHMKKYFLISLVFIGFTQISFSQESKLNLNTSKKPKDISDSF